MANTRGIPYFSHDCNAMGNKKIVRAEARWPHAYAWFFKTLELLRQEEEFKFLVVDIDIWADRLKADITDYSKFIYESNLFKNDGEHFWSSGLGERLELTVNLSNRRSEIAKERWSKRKGTTNEPPAPAPTIPVTPPNNLPPDTLAGIPLIASKIVLPVLGFQLSPLSETSLRTQLAICEMPFDDFQKTFPNIPKETHESFKSFNKLIDDNKSEIDLRFIRSVNRQVDISSFHKCMKKFRSAKIIREALVRIARRGVQPGNDLPLTLDQYCGFVKKEIDEGKFVVNGKGNGANTSTADTKDSKELRADGFYWIGNNKYLEVNTEDWPQVQLLAKHSQGRLMDIEELKKIKEEKGEKKFRIWLIP